MRVEQICPTNQWASNMFLAAIERESIAEQKQAALNGRIIPLGDVIDSIGLRWLDAMMPAGNG